MREFDLGMEFQDEFYSNINKPDNLFNDCTEWLGKINESGYGVLDRGQFAHRISFLIHNGRIPDGFEIDHLCRNKKCVNPHHLEAVSQTLNRQRRIYQRNPDNQ
jgi:hypothetical protein